MILDLPLPSGWSKVPGKDTQGGDLIWPSDSDPRSLTARAPSLLLVSPLLPLPESLPSLIQQALDSEPDYQITRRSNYMLPRLGPWEVVVLLTFGCSAESRVETGRIYAALDAGYGAFLLVFLDKDPRRLPERQRQLYELITLARLREGPGQGQEKKPADKKDVVQGRRLGMPPQLPPLDIFLKEVLYRHLID
jgi:hypothetical protein